MLCAEECRTDPVVKSCWSTSMPTLPPSDKTLASDQTAPALDGTRWPIFVRRACKTFSAIYGLFGGLKSAVTCSPNAAAHIGSNSKLPVWPVKKMIGFLLFAKLEENLRAFHFHQAGLFGLRIKVENLVQKQIFSHQPCLIAPHAEGNFLHLGIGLFRERPAQVFKCDLVCRPNSGPMRLAARSRKLIAAFAGSKRNVPRIANTSWAVNQCSTPTNFRQNRYMPSLKFTRSSHSQKDFAENVTCFHPLQCAASMPSNSTIVSTTGLTWPLAIFCMALAMFSMRQPKEPIRRNCC